MKRVFLISALLGLLAVAGCVGLRRGAYAPANDSQYDDLAKVESVEPDREYRLGNSGIVGTVEDDHILVTRVVRNSVADGTIRRGDMIRGLQYRGLGGNIRATVAKRIYRLGRDWDWHFYVTVERPSLRRGKGNTVTFDLRVPPAPGDLCHYGPTGFFAKRYTDHLVIDLVEAGSPSDGKLRKGDEIVAVNGQPITPDAYQLFTAAVDKAESEPGGGILELTVRKMLPDENGPETTDSETETPPPTPTEEAPSPRTRPVHSPPQVVTLELEVLGTYSATAPVNCDKTDAIITKVADKLVQDGNYGRLDIGLLGLLATGEKEYIDHVGKVLHGSDFARPDVKLSMSNGYVSWPYSYHTITLCEYYLLTRDDYVLPAIEAHALIIARGQDAAGLWNHRMADPAANFGKLHGRLYGYGAINQTSIALWIGMILAEKCGVEHPEIRAAIEKTHSLYGNWIDKGALPYGNHGPMEHMFTNNGTSGSIAVAYALLGDTKGARFYSRMSAAAADEILTGHTGPWFNILWSGLGANVAGPEVAAAYNRTVHWLRTVTRSWDGRFFDMAAWGASPKPGRLCSSGAYLLNYCVGRRAIHITGKGMDESLWITGQAAADAVDAGKIDEADQKTASLLDLLGSPLPPVRVHAAQLLAIRDVNVEDEVMELLATGSWDQRIGAIHAIANLKLASAIDELMAIVMDEKDDLWVRQLAAGTAADLGADAEYGEQLLKLIAADKPYDTHGDFDRALGFAVTKMLEPDPYAHNVDRDVLYTAAAKLLGHKHMWGRGSGMGLVRNIPLEDLHRVVDKMVYVIEDKDRTYTSYHGDGHRQTGLEILYGLGIRESIDLTVSTIKEPTGRGGPRMRGRKRLLNTFGAEAEYAIPRIREVLGKDADEIIKKIETSSDPREMISLEEARQLGQSEDTE